MFIIVAHCALYLFPCLTLAYSFIHNLMYNFSYFFLCPMLNIVNFFFSVGAFIGVPTVDGELCWNAIK